MLMITIIAILLAIPLSTTKHSGLKTINATLFTRITAIAILYAALLSYLSVTVPSIDTGLGLFSGLLHTTTLTQNMEVFILVTGALCILPWITTSTKYSSTNGPSMIAEYPLIILFTTMGATFLLGSADLVSMYLSIELQSFGVYILAAIYRDSETATAASLKYFLLGALSSALILLGSGLVYGYSGLTSLDSIYELMSVPAMSDAGYKQGLVLGIMLIIVGLLFKVAAAPFHYWAPDVYDGTPTIVTTWLTVMPKISIFVFLLELFRGCELNVQGTSDSTITSLSEVPTHLILVCAFLSLVIGTVVGLGQYRLKRLFAYSTISHVGFLLLALAISSESGTDAFIFYIVQYSLTNVNAFFVLLGFGYLMNSANPYNATLNPSVNNGTTRGHRPLSPSGLDIQMISELQGQFRGNPILGLSMALCLFSMAGVPPMVGFFAKYTVLYTAIQNGYMYLSVVAILGSVVSAVYYLRVIRVIHFDRATDLSAGGQVGPAKETNQAMENQPALSSDTVTLSSVHSYVISTLTLILLLFAANPNLLLNSTSIMALSVYST